MQCVDENRNDALTRLQVIADAFALLPDEHAIASVDQAIEQLKEVFLNPKTRVSFMLYEQIESSSAIPSTPRPRRYV